MFQFAIADQLNANSVSVVRHVQHEIAPHNTQTNHADFTLLCFHRDMHITQPTGTGCILQSQNHLPVGHLHAALFSIQSQADEKHFLRFMP
jgi:hypothetical protein